MEFEDMDGVFNHTTTAHDGDTYIESKKADGKWSYFAKPSPGKSTTEGRKDDQTVNHPSHILTTAEKTISQRASDRDTETERSMAAIVNAFNAIHGTNLTEAQGWNFMVILKIKRAFTGRYKEDDHVDMAAYVALCSEAMLDAEQPTRKEPPPADWTAVKS